ncbi:DUF4192 domain-containing protein [Streptomyces diastaticus]|uniref:DUF4192 domain-containing protein n=1 Tax=Streptomyces diastaticus subsp. diastaticus TaxID=68040 RepID=A0ABQ1CVF7_STRDI|nr:MULTISPECIES: DUF4192 domain-containing protein [Streptomyces]PJM80747.1 hypothetical protein CH313_26455 [Streptomyces sp. TSRI0384-2]GFH74135.1 hypothetical protein Sdia_49030 [Streptomyces diastaticus subsp. diastaticus]GGU42247.1 hypothetical protein GCM10015534_51170 [Streptomyces diastaticus subsp. diastaticus]
MSDHTNTTPTDSGEPGVTVRTHTELADALPYLLGFQPDENLVLVAVHGSRGRFGGRVRVGIPADPADWPVVADAVTDALVTGSARRLGTPDAIVAFLCREPGPGETGTAVMEYLRPLAQHVRLAAGARDVPVVEALCLSGHRCWSYCCPDPVCCPPEGTAQKPPGTSAVAAAAAYAGMTVRGSLRAMERRLLPPDDGGDQRWAAALDTACARLLPRLVEEEEAPAVAEETLTTAGALITRLLRLPRAPESEAADARDDRAIGADEAAAVIVGLQDRETRDRAAEWMEGPLASPALRLWRALARRCTGAYDEYAAAPLALAGWVAWSAGDRTEARVALALALRADPDYTFAVLLHHACDEGLAAESIRRVLRRAGKDRRRAAVAAARAESAGPAETAEATASAEKADAAMRTVRAENPEERSTPEPRRRTIPLPSAPRWSARRGDTTPSPASGPVNPDARTARPSSAARPPFPARPRGGRPGGAPGGPRAPYGSGPGRGPSGKLPLRSSRRDRRPQGSRPPRGQG